MDNKLRIVNFLGKMNKCEFTMHQASKLLNIPYATFYRTINGMKDLVNIKILGKSKIISLNANHKSIKSYLIVGSEEERKEFLERNPIINQIHDGLETEDVVLLFGSYAKGISRKDSDIDILVINENGEKDISFSKYELIFNKTINPIFFTYNEFKLMLEGNEENVGKQALKHHILLNNPETFWGLVINERL